LFVPFFSSGEEKKGTEKREANRMVGFNCINHSILVLFFFRRFFFSHEKKKRQNYCFCF
jgi:hypothetical protein